MTMDAGAPAGTGAHQFAQWIEEVAQKHAASLDTHLMYATCMADGVIQLDVDGYPLYAAEHHYLVLQNAHYVPGDRLVVTPIGGPRGAILVLGKWQDTIGLEPYPMGPPGDPGAPGTPGEQGIQGDRGLPGNPVDAGYEKTLVFVVTGELDLGPIPIRLMSPRSMTIQEVVATVATAPYGNDTPVGSSAVIVDVWVGETPVSIFSDPSLLPIIPLSTLLSNVAVPDLTTVLEKNDVVTISILQIGDITPGSDLVVQVRCLLSAEDPP